MESKQTIGNFLCRNEGLKIWVGDADLLCSFCKNQAKCQEVKKTIEFFELKTIESEVRHERAA